MVRTILHVDMDAFFAAVEVLDHPELRGKAVLVGGTGRRGVVCAASYEARRFGCHSAQPMSIARRKCPHAIVMPVRGARYRELSKQVFAIFDRFTPLVQPLSIDEAFLDLTGTERLHGSGEDAATTIRRMILEETGLTGSIGVAPNKFIAKLASDEDKPDGLTVIGPERVERYLASLPIARMWGAGPATQARLEKMRIRTFADLQALSERQLRETFGDLGGRFFRLSRGLDDRPVVPDSQAKSIGHEQTFGEDVEDLEALRSFLLRHTENVAYRLRKHDLQTRCITVKIRFGDFQTITRSTTLDFPTDETDVIWRHTLALLEGWAGTAFAPVRLLGVSTSQLSPGGQLGLFDQPQREKHRKLDQTTDMIRERFGDESIRRGGSARKDGDRQDGVR